MEHPLIHDRGRGPELIGTRITIYNLVPYLIKPTWTEAAIAEANRVTAEQVAAMRAYFLSHYAEVMAQHDRIEERIRKGMEEQAKRFPPTPYDLANFPGWVAQREREASVDGQPFPVSPTERMHEFLSLRRSYLNGASKNGVIACKE